MKIVSALLLASLLLLGCNNKGAGTFSSRRSFSTGPFAVHIALGYLPLEEYQIREAVREHVQEYTVSGFKGGPWKFTKAQIMIAGPKIKYLNSPHRIGVEGYVDFKQMRVVVVAGYKNTVPTLFRELHQLQRGPDPYAQDPLLMWGAVASVGSRIVAGLEAKR